MGKISGKKQFDKEEKVHKTNSEMLNDAQMKAVFSKIGGTHTGKLAIAQKEQVKRQAEEEKTKRVHNLSQKEKKARAAKDKRRRDTQFCHNWPQMQKGLVLPVIEEKPKKKKSKGRKVTFGGHSYNDDEEEEAVGQFS